MNDFPSVANPFCHYIVTHYPQEKPLAMRTFNDQNFRELCGVVIGVYTDAEHVTAIGWDADAPVHHIEGAVIAEIHSRMEEFIGERIEVADRLRAQHIPPEALSESHTRRRREEIIDFLSKHSSEGLSHPDMILDQTVQAVVDNRQREFGTEPECSEHLRRDGRDVRAKE